MKAVKMSMNPIPRKLSLETEDLIKQFLENGGTVTKMDAFKRSEELEYKHMYGRGKPKKAKEE